MHYTEYANPTGRHFVLVHGIGMGKVVFNDVARLLSIHGTVLAIDLPGFGESPQPVSATGKGIDIDLVDTANIVANFVAAQTDGLVTLVGHSMGTQIVVEIAARQPELIDTLVLIAPTVNRCERTVRQQAFRLLQDLADETIKVLLIGIWQYAKTSPKWFFKKLMFMLAHKIENVLPQLTVPTLVLRGETDRVCPQEWVTYVTGLISDAQMIEIPGRGHEAVIKKPDPASSMILDFVSNFGMPLNGDAKHRHSK